MKIGDRSLQKFLKDFSNEVVVWCHVHHRNCLPFYGVLNEDADTKCLVSPWMTNGHIIGYLQTNPNADRLPLILDIVCGLEYLHSMQPTVIHGDLKGANILITSSGRACLADFGIVTVRDSHVQMTTTFEVRGTKIFMAPELWGVGNDDDLKKLDRRRCDMYAFGCVCYEIYTGMSPIHNPLAARRPPRPTEARHGLDDDMWDLIESSWKEEPTVRPTAADALRQISFKMRFQGKSDVRPATEVEWNVEFLADAGVTIAVEDPFAVEHT